MMVWLSCAHTSTVLVTSILWNFCFYPSVDSERNREKKPEFGSNIYCFCTGLSKATASKKKERNETNIHVGKTVEK